VVSIAETIAQRTNRIKREVRRVGFWRFLDVLAYRVYHRLFLHTRDVRQKKGLMERVTRAYPPVSSNVRQLITSSPNSPETRHFLEDLRPDLVIARCKVILKPDIFTIPRLGTFVMHPGICPEYRNAHGCFWAWAEGEPDKVGMTLLKVDKGIDTGPVYGLFFCPFDDERESHIAIQQRCVFENLDKLRGKLLEIAAGTAATIDTTGRKSRNWGQPWLSKYLRRKLTKHRART
jgi:methionyl-tRNA formyltransferase